MYRRYCKGAIIARPTIEELDSLLNYDECSGELYWKSSGTGRRAGGRAGGVDGSAVRVTLRYKRYPAHRVIWAMCYKEWPSDDLMVDHINRNPYDNRLCNLRLATNQQNQFNRKAKNVHLQPDGKWRVTLMLDGRNINFGRFKDEEFALFVAQEARDKYHKEFTCNG